MAKKRKNPAGRKERRARKAGHHQKAGYYALKSSGRAIARERRRREAMARLQENAPVKTLKKSTGWMKVTRVKIERRRGGDVVLVQKPKRKRKR